MIYKLPNGEYISDKLLLKLFILESISIMKKFAIYVQRELEEKEKADSV